jgi:aspartate carbamoyltransferase catalytic subunit
LDKDKIKVLEILNTEVNEATRDFNFRTLRKLIAFVQYDENKAKDLFRATTEIDELKQVYLEVIKKSDIVKTQILLFIEMTGRSRRTFFRTKKELSVKVSRNIDTGTCTQINNTGGKTNG